jgi:hypothetical protein
MAIANVRGWRLREPDSSRRYTVLRLETRGSMVGYGEGGPAPVSEIVEARVAVTGHRPNESEYVRHRLAAWPTTARTHLAMADPEDDGSRNCAAIAMLRRKAGRRAPAQRGPPNGIGQHRGPRDPRSECQCLVEGIANGSGEVPSLPKHKTISADSVLALGCIKFAEEPISR